METRKIQRPEIAAVKSQTQHRGFNIKPEAGGQTFCEANEPNIAQIAFNRARALSRATVAGVSVLIDESFVEVWRSILIGPRKTLV